MQQQWVGIIGNIKEQVRNEYEEQHKRSLEEFKKELSSQIFIQLSQMGSQYSPLIEVDLQALDARLSTKGSNVETADVDPSGDKNVSLKPTMGFRVNDGEDSYTTLPRIDPSVSQRIPTQHVGNADIHQGSNCDFTAQLARFMASLVIDVPSQAYWITQLTKYDFGGQQDILLLQYLEFTFIELLFCQNLLRLLLELTRNYFNGSIPKSLGRLSSVVTLNLLGNRLTGSIPSEIGDMASLQELRIYDLKGPTMTFPNLKNLKLLLRLELRNCLITVPIPNYIGEIESLKSIDLSSNMLTGSIPDSFQDLGNLNYLFLTNNSLSGPIPDWILSIKKHIDLSLNNFTKTSANNCQMPDV
ncbi:hypothetical protein JHK84_048049 [Glycine max]|nr:hypothetical protein JHK85_048636 [Glycine max]KAG5103080.1 hypothetical protein JHK84_048049 [Glycine max]